MANQKVFSVTPAQVALFKKEILADKDSILTESPENPSAGTVTHGSGITKVIIGYSYDAAKGALSVHVEKAPPFSSSAVINHITDLIKHTSPTAKG
jgi:hypothetical protein